jgi:hypothetical protein
VAGNYPVDLPLRLDDAGASPTTPQAPQHKQAFYDEIDLLEILAESMRQREHLDEAMVAYWVTFSGEGIRLPIQFVALHMPQDAAFGGHPAQRTGAHV